MRKIYALIGELRNYAKAYQYSDSMTKARRGAMLGAINAAIGGEKNRHRFFGWLINGNPASEVSSNDLDFGMLKSLYDWCGFREDDGHWYTSDQFQSECAAIARAFQLMDTSTMNYNHRFYVVEFDDGTRIVPVQSKCVKCGYPASEDELTACLFSDELYDLIY